MQGEAKAARNAAEAAEAELASFKKECGADGAGGAMSASDELKVKKEYMKFRKAYVERKRNCMEILGNISEGTGKRVKALMEEIGLECDEDYGVVKNQFPPI